MSLPVISAREAVSLISNGAAVVDVREADEHARERIPGAVNMPLSRLNDWEIPPAATLVFHCKSGARTNGAAGLLAARVGGACDAYIVEGGLIALGKAGLKTVRDTRQPIDMQRQVQIGAGGLALAGTILGVLLWPGFLAVPGFVGAGLLFAGVTGFCGMAKLLARAPWNRRALNAAE